MTGIRNYLYFNQTDSLLISKLVKIADVEAVIA